MTGRPELLGMTGRPELLGMTPAALHNMSVPPTSRLTVARAHHPGPRYRVALAWQAGRPARTLGQRLAKEGWRAAWDVLEAAGDPPGRDPRGRRSAERLVAHLEEALRTAAVPARVGVFLEEDVGEGNVPLLRPAAALAVLARRSGPLYLPARRLEPSLADPQPLVLFFPEEDR